MGKKKYYVVWRGRKTGIFDSWKECNKQISSFPNAQYKSFQTIETARQAFLGNYQDYKGVSVFETTLSKEELKLIGKPNLNTISVDAACSGNPGIMEYQGVETKSKRILFRMGPFKDSTNNIGEFLALVHGLAFLKQKSDNRPIYSDSKIAINWVRNIEIRTLNPKTKNNQDSFELVERAIKWLKNNKYNNKILKWETKAWGEIPADFGRK